MDAFRKWMNERLITRSKKGPRTLDLEVERAKTWPLGLAILVACNRWKCFFLKNDQTRKVFVFKSKLRAAKDNIRPYTFLSFSVTKCWNKSSPISSISCPKVTTSVLLKKNYAFENSPTSRQTFGVLLQENWLPSTFIYRPIWSRCYRSISFHQNWPQSFKLIWANWTGRKTGRTIIQLLDKWLILIKHLGSLG